MASLWKKKTLLLWVSFFASTITMAQPRIDLTEGTLFLNGGLIFQYDMVDFENTQHTFGLKTDLGGGYFVIDNLAVGLGLPGEWRFTPSSGGSLGVKVFTTYHFDMNSAIFPYVGVNVTPGYNMTEKSFQLKAGLDGGILVSLSENIALDFGLKPEVTFKLFDKDKWKISIPTGFLGVRAVF